MARLAFTTFAIMKGPYGDPQVAGFEALTPAVFLKAEEAPGFIARAHELDDNSHLTNFERDWGDWGSFCVPRFYDGGFDTANDTRASTLSLWDDIDAVKVFAYSGLHKRALDQREKWFRKPDWPTFAMWWVADDQVPIWTEACAMLEHLHDHGPMQTAFNFTHSFAKPGSAPASKHLTH